MPVDSPRDVIKKLKWHALRWKIETFHKILKFSCKAEESRLRTAEGVVNLIAVLPTLAPAQIEIRPLDQLVKDRNEQPSQRKSVSAYLIPIARLGCYLACVSAPRSDKRVIWKGTSHLTDIELGFFLDEKLAGN